MQSSIIYTIHQIAKHISFVKHIVNKEKNQIKHIAFDSRNVYDFAHTLFFNFSNNLNYVEELYKKGCKNFIISTSVSNQTLPNANFIIVENVLESMHQLAISHRLKFQIPIIGITGSNGKTILKEWLYQMLEDDFNIVKTPQSFNSQIGVPMSVWNIKKNHELGIFEAGISQKKEMSKLEKIIAPTIGVFTNLGEAHQENFSSKNEKLKEKIVLFKNAKIVFYQENTSIQKEIFNINPNAEHFTWGKSEKNNIQIIQQKYFSNTSQIKIIFKHSIYNFEIPFIDFASIENCIYCIAILLYFKKTSKQIQQKINLLSSIPMRLAMTKGNHNCLLINDTYSNDIDALKIGIEYLQKRQDYTSKSLILSDFQHPQNNQEIASILNLTPINKIIFIGKKFHSAKKYFKNKLHKKYFFYPSLDDFKKNIETHFFKDEIILFKGTRNYEFETLIDYFKSNIHETTLEINLKNLQFNLHYIQQLLKPTTKVIAIIKAFAYGSGSIEIAHILQKKQIAYLAVAYINEAIELRQNNITMPIIVMNPNEKNFDFLIQYHLQPEIYSFEILDQFIQYLSQKNIFSYPIHLKIDTGMNRLGFKKEEMLKLLPILKKNIEYLSLETVFSHLVGSENKSFDSFSMQQFKLFKSIIKKIQKHTQQNFKSHILNSGGILRHPKMQLDHVRLGIALYGIMPHKHLNFPLKNVLTLKTSIAQIKTVSVGETVGYNRQGKVNKNMKIATIRIGYAEGFQRKLGNGLGKVMIHNTLAPTIGSVCMDLTMIDISNIPNVQVNDPVIIFGNDLPLTTIAEWAQTIPYEIITNISPRVRREYIQ